MMPSRHAGAPPSAARQPRGRTALGWHIFEKKNITTEIIFQSQKGMARNSPINVKDKGSKTEVSSESRNSGKKKMK